MENSIIDDIYLNIAKAIFHAIEEDWSKAIIKAELCEGSIEFSSEYVALQDTLEKKYFDVPFDTFEAFEQLHEITTEDSDNKWNRATYILEPTGKFNIDFEWDQALADEIERLNNE